MKPVEFLKSIKIELNNLRLNWIHNDRFISTDEEEFIVDSIKKNGYVIIEDAFDLNWCENMKEIIDSLILNYRDVIWKDKEESDHRIFGANLINNFIEEYYRNQVIVNLLQTYEGTRIKDGFTLGAKLKYTRGNSGSGGGWHRDHPNVKQSKSIVYLNNVTNENGPFQFIKGSHTSVNVYKDSGRYKFNPFQQRFSDGEIQKIIENEPERLATLTCKAGSIILTDTRGIHRGMPIEKGERYALTNYFWFHTRIPYHMRKHLVSPPS